MSFVVVLRDMNSSVVQCLDHKWESNWWLDSLPQLPQFVQPVHTGCLVCLRRIDTWCSFSPFLVLGDLLADDPSFSLFTECRRNKNGKMYMCSNY